VGSPTRFLNGPDGAELLNEHSNARATALVADRAYPIDLNRPRAGTGLPAHDDPIEAIRDEGPELDRPE